MAVLHNHYELGSENKPLRMKSGRAKGPPSSTDRQEKANAVEKEKT